MNCEKLAKERADEIVALSMQVKDLLETRGDLERQLQAPPNPWNTSEPPKDGTTIIVVGRVILTDEMSTCVDSFVASVRWIKDQSNYEGWHYDRDGMTVARTPDDEVKIDWWANYPKEKHEPTN